MARTTIEIKYEGDIDLIASKKDPLKGRIEFKGGSAFIGNPQGIPEGNYRAIVCSGTLWSDGMIKASAVLSVEAENPDMAEAITRADLTKAAKAAQEAAGGNGRK